MDQSNNNGKHTTQDIRQLGKRAQEQRQDLIVVLQTENNNGVNTKIIMHYFPSIEEVAKFVKSTKGHLEGNSVVVRNGSKVEQFDILGPNKLTQLKKLWEQSPANGASRRELGRSPRGTTSIRNFEIETPRSTYDVDVIYEREALSPRSRTGRGSLGYPERKLVIEEPDLDISADIYGESLYPARSNYRPAYQPTAGAYSRSPFSGL